MNRTRGWVRRLSAVAALVGVVSEVPAARAVTIDWVTVGDAGNEPIVLGAGILGAVDYEYRIGKYEITIGQYVEFLNSAAKSDPYGLYSESMGTESSVAGIARTGSPGAYEYNATGPFPISESTPTQTTQSNRPIAYVDWFDAARFANWMHNGQGSGSTETGAYTLNGQTTGTTPVRNPGALFTIPTRDEWFKAAFYKGSGTASGYWYYPTQSDFGSGPNNILSGSTPNMANFTNYSEDRLPVTGTPVNEFSSSQNYLTDVGTFTASPSPYGTFDQGGNVAEWVELPRVSIFDFGSDLSQVWGGGWSGSLESLEQGTPSTELASYDGSGSEFGLNAFGFRLASPFPVPEPASWVLGTGGLVGAAWASLRRRRRRSRA